MGLFQLQNNQVIIDPNVLPIPEFKKLWDRDKTKNKDNAYKELSYVYYMCDFESPYSKISEDKREGVIKTDFIKDETWKPDKFVQAAMDKYRLLIETASTRLVKAVERSLDKISNFLDANEILDEGLVKVVIMTIEKAATTVGAHAKLQEIARKEQNQSTRMRGDKDVGTYER